MNRVGIVLHMCISLTAAVVSPLANEEVFSARTVGRSLAKCLGGSRLFLCLQKEAIYNLDLVLRDNSTWQYSDFIQFEKDENYSNPNNSVMRRSEDSIGEDIAEKLVQLAQARTIRLRVNPRLLEAEMKDYDSVEGRKKKDKDKGMAMFGGLAMVAMMAQMFLGKVMLIAGSAFVMAKIALMVSLLTSLKTKSVGGGNTEHVVTYTDAGGGGHSGSGHSGWHRSLPHYAPAANSHDPIEVDHHHSSSQIPDYYQYDASYQKKDYNFI